MGQIAYPQNREHLQVAHIHVDVPGNVGRETLNLHLAHHLVQDAAGGLYANRHAQQLYAHLHAQNLIQRNPLHIDVNQPVVDRFPLPVHNHRLGRTGSTNFHVEDRVVARIGEKNPRNLLGVHFNGHRIVSRTI